MTIPTEGHRSDIMRRTDDPTTFALQVVRDDVGRRFDTLDKRLDTMVTREAHEAEVRRLDGVDAQLRRDLDAHESEAQRRFDLVEKSVASGDRAILTRLDEERAEREKARRQEHDDRVKGRRWAIGSTIAAGGLGISSTALLLNYLI